MRSRGRTVGTPQRRASVATSAGADVGRRRARASRRDRSAIACRVQAYGRPAPRLARIARRPRHERASVETDRARTGRSGAANAASADQHGAHATPPRRSDAATPRASPAVASSVSRLRRRHRQHQGVERPVPRERSSAAAPPAGGMRTSRPGSACAPADRPAAPSRCALIDGHADQHRRDAGAGHARRSPRRARGCARLDRSLNAGCRAIRYWAPWSRRALLDAPLRQPAAHRSALVEQLHCDAGDRRKARAQAAPDHAGPTIATSCRQAGVNSVQQRHVPHRQHAGQALHVEALSSWRGRSLGQCQDRLLAAVAGSRRPPASRAPPLRPALQQRLQRAGARRRRRDGSRPPACGAWSATSSSGSTSLRGEPQTSPSTLGVDLEIERRGRPPAARGTGPAARGTRSPRTRRWGRRAISEGEARAAR